MNRDDAGGYARRLADSMGLRDWSVHVLSGRPGDDENASICCLWGRRVAEIKLSDDWFADDPPRQRQALVHELIHAHLASMHWLVQDALEPSLHPAYELTLEYAIDAMAEAWAPFLPLPDHEPEKPTKTRTPR